MRGARGASSSPRRLPLLSVLLLPLLGGESLRAGEAKLGERGSPAGTRGHPGSGFGRLERRRYTGVVERLAEGARFRRLGGGQVPSGLGLSVGQPLPPTLAIAVAFPASTEFSRPE